MADISGHCTNSTTELDSIIKIGHHAAPNRKNIIGKTFGRLTVVRHNSRTRGRLLTFDCVCSCGCTITNVSGSSLRRGLTKSCGCLKKERPSGDKSPSFVHGHSGSPTYMAWRGMFQRCYNRNHPKYVRYGGRGIRVHPRWKSFTNFLKDMGTKPPNTSLGRRDNDGNYSPDNCRWETTHQQSNNKSNNRVLTLNGKSQTLKMWASDIGISFGALRMRIHRGWSAEEALQTPIHICP